MRQRQEVQEMLHGSHTKQFIAKSVQMRYNIIGQGEAEKGVCFMDITLNTATSGMRAAMTRQDVTAHNIANAVTPGFEQMNAHQTETAPAGTRVSSITRTPNPNPGMSGTDLARQMVDLKINNNDFTANTKVFKMKDKMVGEVIDLIA
jgi:flagellar basal body rod protein FlgC